MQVHFILLSGGTGSRVGEALPKQFLSLKGRPVLSHSTEAILSWPHTATLVLVSHPDFVEETRDVGENTLSRCEREVPLLVVEGGDSRHASTLAGIQALKDRYAPEDLIFIHDSARPFLQRSELDQLLERFRRDPSAEVASLVSPIPETVIRAEQGGEWMRETLDREEIYVVKTPQALRCSSLGRLLLTPEKRSFTDLLRWAEAAERSCALVEAGPFNIKITTREDLIRLEAMEWSA